MVLDHVIRFRQEGQVQELPTFSHSVLVQFIPDNLRKTDDSSPIEIFRNVFNSYLAE